MKEGWERHLAGAPTFSLVEMGARAPHPGDFGRSLSRHSLRDVSKPRRPSTQPLVNGSQSTACLQAPALSPHSKGDIRTAPPSRSRVKNDYSILGMLSRGNYPSPLVGEGRVRGHPSSGSMLKRISPPSPSGGEGKRTRHSRA